MSLNVSKVLPIILLLCVSSIVTANDYPTRDRVEYVLNCFQKLGRNSMDDLQTCSCRIDSVASAMPFEIYGYAVTYNRNKKMSGEKGGVFRDNKSGKEFSNQLFEIEDAAKGQCIQVVHIMAPTDLTKDKKYNKIKVQ